ncbi:MAG: hypothetical protein ABFD58_08580 [Anaerolineaceae bacterium]
MQSVYRSAQGINREILEDVTGRVRAVLRGKEGEEKQGFTTSQIGEASRQYIEYRGTKSQRWLTAWGVRHLNAEPNLFAHLNIYAKRHLPVS